MVVHQAEMPAATLMQVDLKLLRRPFRLYGARRELVRDATLRCEFWLALVVKHSSPSKDFR